MRMITRTVAALLLLALAIPVPTMAQSKEPAKTGYGQGYAFWGVGGINAEDAILHFGGGGEAVFYKGLGFGVELGFVAPWDYIGEGVGSLCLNGYYEHRRQAASKVVPFVTGGYTLLFRQGVLNAANFGGGIHYWFKEKVGLRFELRDHFSPEYFKTHAWEARIGIEIR